MIDEKKEKKADAKATRVAGHRVSDGSISDLSLAVGKQDLKKADGKSKTAGYVPNP